MTARPQDLVDFGARILVPDGGLHPEQVVTLDAVPGPSLAMRYGALAIADPWWPEVAPQEPVIALGGGDKATVLSTVALARDDGTVDRLTGGWQVLSHRAVDSSKVVKRDGDVLQTYHPFTKAAQLPVEPGKVMGVDVEVFPTGAVLEAGHRLRITVQAFDTPHLSAPLPQLGDSAGGIITIHHSATYPSRLVLPVRDR